MLFLLVITCTFKVANSESTKIVGINSSLPNLPLLDSCGRERYFHGSNVVIKKPPFLPTFDAFNFDDSFSSEDIAMFKRLGWNIVRLGFMWRAAEPERGQFNETYFTLMKNFVSRLNDNGIYVLLDFHQDLLSEKFCGEGVPLWAAVPMSPNFPIPLTDEPYPLDSEGIPFAANCSQFAWGDYYFSEAASSAFQAIWNNDYGLLDALAAYFQMIAQNFGSMPNVLGYNLVNEPWPGDIYKHPKLLLPGVADRVNFAPAYDKIADAIHSADNESLIIFEGATWDNFAFGFENVPGGATFANRSVVGYHYYRPPRVESIKTAIRLQKDGAQGLKCGTMLTEFWALQGGYPLADMLNDVQMLDAALQSWIGWDYKTGGVWNYNGTVNLPLATTLSRPYAYAVAGNVLTMIFDDQLHVLFVRYKANPKITQPTELFVPALHYPNGVNVDVSPSSFGVASYDQQRAKVSVRYTHLAQPDSIMEITVTENPYSKRRLGALKKKLVEKASRLQRQLLTTRLSKLVS